MEGGEARFPAGFPQAQVFVGARPALTEGFSQRVIFGFAPSRSHPGDGLAFRHLVQGGEHLGGHYGVAVRHDEHRRTQLYFGSPGRHVGKDHQRVVDVAPRGAAGRIVDDHVVVDEQGIKPQFLGLAGGFDDGFGGGGESQVVGVGKPERVLDHAVSIRCSWSQAVTEPMDSRLCRNDGLALKPSLRRAFRPASR